MHYSQKRRYYFFIAIAKFKTILSYSLAQACILCLAAYPSSHTQLRQLANFPSSHTQLRQLADFPSLILRLSFAYPSLNLRSRFAYDCATLTPHLRHTCATHFGKLSEFAKVNQLRQLTPPLAQASPPLLILRHILGCASSLTFLRHILGCASSPTFLRLSFAQGSLILRSRFAYPSLKVR